GRSYAPKQAAKTTLFAAGNEARYRKNRLRFFLLNEGFLMALKRKGTIVGVVILVGLGLLAWGILRPGPLAWVDGKRVALAEYNGKPTGVPADFTDSDQQARGSYLTVAADCEACHTVEGGQLFAGGRPFDTESGTLYSPNITPDPETGIGK